MRYYLIAGEASGDLHGSRLIRQLRLLDPEAVCRGWGGQLMEQEGMFLVKHYRELAFMGFWEVARHIRTILKNFSLAQSDILHFKPDAVILIDYPGFNLRLAKFLKEKKIRVIYYISPQLWAWKESRVNLIKKYIDKMLVILPFEKAFYQAHGIEAFFCGHPLIDIVSETRKDADFLSKYQLTPSRKIIALLPGSRKQEITALLPVMISASHHFPDYQFVIAGLEYLGVDYYQSFLSHTNVRLVLNETHQLLHHAYAALVASGTATLEAALFNVPQVVCYRGNYISYLIGRLLIKVPYISLVNLVLEKKAVDELIQSQCNEHQLVVSLKKILDENTRMHLFRDYDMLRQKLGGPGASLKAAKLIVDYLHQA